MGCPAARIFNIQASSCSGHCVSKTRTVGVALAKALRSPKSKIQNPKSKIQNPKPPLTHEFNITSEPIGQSVL
jgi:hypothetical protein